MSVAETRYRKMRHSARRFPFFALLLAAATAVPHIARTQNRFHIALDYHYHIGLSERFYGHTLTRKDGNMRGNSLHLTALYDISRRITAGAGFGADRYEAPGYNTFPVYGTLHYRPMRKFLDGYVYTNLGYGIMSSTDDIYPGWMWDLGVGYTKMFRKHSGVNLQFGYNLKEFGHILYYRAGEDRFIEGRSNLRHSLSIGIGYVF